MLVEEIPPAGNAAAEPTLSEDAAHQQFRMMLQGGAAGEDALPADRSGRATTSEPEPAHPPVQVELQDVLKNKNLDDKRRGEITQMMETLRRNLDKIEQHGQRADALLKRMQMYSREALANIAPPAPMPLQDESQSFPEEIRRSA
jgi:hypothetical protein